MRLGASLPPPSRSAPTLQAPNPTPTHHTQSRPNRPPPPIKAFHTGGKDAVRELVYVEVAEKLRRPLHVRSTDHGGEAVYGAGLPGRPIFVVKDAKDLFVRTDEDGAPHAPRGEGGGGGMGGGGGGGAPRPRKPRPSGGAVGGGGQSARDKERDATWEAKYNNLLHFVRSNGHRPRRTGEDKERQMCFWLAQQQRKMKDGSLSDDKRDKLMIVLAVKGPATRIGGGTPSGRGGGGGGSEGRYDDDDDDEGDEDDRGDDDDDDDEGGYGDDDAREGDDDGDDDGEGNGGRGGGGYGGGYEGGRGEEGGGAEYRAD